jgi:uncharacterized protein HemX
VKIYLQFISFIIITGLFLGGCNATKEQQQTEQRKENKSLTTADKIKYLDDLKALLKETSRELKVLNKVLEMNNRRNDPNDTSFKLMQEKQKLDNISLRFKNITAPETMSKFHNYNINALTFFSEGSSKAASGIKTNNQALCKEASGLFRQGNTEIAMAKSELNYSKKQLSVDGLM